MSAAPSEPVAECNRCGGRDDVRDVRLVRSEAHTAPLCKFCRHLALRCRCGLCGRVRDYAESFTGVGVDGVHVRICDDCREDVTTEPTPVPVDPRDGPHGELVEALYRGGRL